MKRNKKLALGMSVLASSILSFNAIAADAEKKDLMDLSIDDILNTPITVASGSKSLTLRESPGIVTLVTEDDIKKSGARDLQDILLMVPGFQFHSDVQGVVGPSFRGNYAIEGKVMLLIDGIEQNDILYQNIEFGNHYSADTIQKIEIIRGPGSALYGGTAELAVINVVTKGAEVLNGLQTTTTLGQKDFKASDNYMRRNFTLSYGKKFENELKLAMHFFTGLGYRSYGTVYDTYGSKYSTTKATAQNPFNINISAAFKGLELRYMKDVYETTNIGEVAYGAGTGLQYPGWVTNADVGDPTLTPTFPMEMPFPTQFKTQAVEAKYTAEIMNGFRFTPKFMYKDQWPYNTDQKEFWDGSTSYGATRKHYSRMDFTGTFAWDLNEKMNLQFGGEYFVDKKYVLPEAVPGQETKDKSTAAFVQYIWNNEIVNFTTGARYDTTKYQERVNASTGLTTRDESRNTSFVPRFALTKVVGPWHAKALYSKAFRSPSVASYANARDPVTSTVVKGLPEKTTVLELETGMQLTEKVFVTANYFNTKINDPIIYFTPNGGRGGYSNFKTTGTSGFEFELKELDALGSTKFTGSYYIANKDKPDVYKVTNDIKDPGIPVEDAKPKLMAGIPNLKVTLDRAVHLTDKINLDPTLIYQSESYSHAPDDAIAAEKDANADVSSRRTKMQKNKATVLLNTFVSYKDAFGAKGLTVGAGVYNILNTKYGYTSAYDSLIMTKPGQEREYLLKVSYEM